MRPFINEKQVYIIQDKSKKKFQVTPLNGLYKFIKFLQITWRYDKERKKSFYKELIDIYINEFNQTI